MPDPITLLDSEIAYLIAWHASESAKHSYDGNYGDQWKKHQGRMETLTAFLSACLDEREHERHDHEEDQ